MRTKLLLGIALTAALFLTACQPMPESDVVVEKDIDRMLASALENQESSNTAKTLAQKIDAPGSYTESFTTENGKTAFQIDANVVLPESNAVPVIRVTKHVFTQEEADLMLGLFLGEDALYTIPNAMTKEQMEEKLIEYYGMRDGSIPIDVDGEDSGNVDRLNEIIASYEQALLEAEDTPVRVLASREFETPKGAADSSAQKIEGVAETNQTDVYFSVANCYPLPNMVKAIYIKADTVTGVTFNNTAPYYGLSDPDSPIVPEGFSLTKEEAMAVADGALKTLGIEDMACVAASYAVMPNNAQPGGALWFGKTFSSQEAKDFHWAYKMQYARCYSNVPVTITKDNGTGVADEEQYAEPWEYEKLEIIVDESGIVSFLYQSPYEVVETVTDDAALLPFQDVQSILPAMLQASYAWLAESNDIVSAAVNISEIRLGLMRITEPNLRDQGLLVPVWDFFGSIAITDSSGNTHFFTKYDSLLTINAIDGSTINRSLGY
ncbi:MAG: DUF6034 family protein [Clostridiaceae bacterium]